MEDKFNFKEFEKPKDAVNPALSVEKDSKKKEINFQKMPDNVDALLSNDNKAKMIEKFMGEEAIPMPYERDPTNSYLTLVLSPNFRELEMMIRGLEHVKRLNPLTQREEIILRKIQGHPLNEYGINMIISELKVYCSPEIKLGRKRPRDYYNSIQHVGRSIVRLVYKNLKNFGMDNQIKQRNAKRFCNAIIEFVDASYSRSIEGKENDLSRATEIKIEGNMDSINDPAKYFSSKQKEALKN